MYDEVMLRRVRDRTDDGMTSVQIKEALGIPMHEVKAYRWIIAGERLSPTALYSAGQREEARQILEDGGSYAQAGRAVGAPAATVSKWWPGMGWSKEQKSQAMKERWAK